MTAVPRSMQVRANSAGMEPSFTAWRRTNLVATRQTWARWSPSRSRQSTLATLGRWGHMVLASLPLIRSTDDRTGLRRGVRCGRDTARNARRSGEGTSCRNGWSALPGQLWSGDCSSLGAGQFRSNSGCQVSPAFRIPPRLGLSERSRRHTSHPRRRHVADNHRACSDKGSLADRNVLND